MARSVFDNGGIIGRVNTPMSNVASGVWNLPAQFDAISNNKWPKASIAHDYAGTNSYAATSGVPFNTYTFSNVNLGSYERKVIVIAYNAANSTYANNTLSSATIAGQTATIFHTNNNNAWQNLAIITASNIAATTGDIVLNFAGNINTVGSSYYSRLVATVYSTNRSSVEGFTLSQTAGTSASLSVAINANNRQSALGIVGFICSSAATLNANADLTVDYNQLLTNNPSASDRFTFASGIKNSAFTTATASAATTYSAMCSLTLY